MMATRAPSDAIVSAMANPIPLLPPVTTAVAPANPRSTGVSLRVVCDHVVRNSQPTQAKPLHPAPNVGAGPAAGIPMPVNACPDDTVDRLGFQGRLDIIEKACF